MSQPVVCSLCGLQYPASATRIHVCSESSGFSEPYDSKAHAEILQHELYGFLSKCSHILDLLFEQEISPGKAIEAIVELKLGRKPALPSGFSEPTATPDCNDCGLPPDAHDVPQEFPEYRCEPTASPDDAFVERVEDEIGMGKGAWDMVNHKELCAAVLKVAAPTASPEPIICDKFTSICDKPAAAPLSEEEDAALEWAEASAKDNLASFRYTSESNYYGVGGANRKKRAEAILQTLRALRTRLGGK